MIFFFPNISLNNYRNDNALHEKSRIPIPTRLEYLTWDSYVSEGWPRLSWSFTPIVNNKFVCSSPLPYKIFNVLPLRRNYHSLVDFFHFVWLRNRLLTVHDIMRPYLHFITYHRGPCYQSLRRTQAPDPQLGNSASRHNTFPINGQFL